jgi:adenylate kinase
MVIVLLGPPGVGKGTQGALLAEDGRWRRIVTGDLLRAATGEGTELGRKAKTYMDAGDLVPDDLIVALVTERLATIPPEDDVIFDGFPRTVPQARSLDEALPDVNRSVDAVVVLEADDAVLVRRLSGRRNCPECGEVYNVHFSPPEVEGVCGRCGSALVHREDDTPETVSRRLEVYRNETEPLIRFYEESDAEVLRIAGDGEVDAVQSEIRESLNGLGGSTGQDGAHTGNESERVS